MISESEALAAILPALNPLASRRSALSLALGDFARTDLYAPLPLPQFDNSAMDGYAVMAADCRLGRRLRVVGEQPAGPDRQLRIAPGEAVRIFTGAPIPAGADAILIQEEAERDGENVVVRGAVAAGEYVRKRGSDLATGQKIVTRGRRLNASTLALLAAQGFRDVETGTPPRVAIVSTGDELVDTDEALKPGQIYDSNSVFLKALVHSCGATVALAERCRDNLDATEAILRRGVGNDALIISGGVSVGELDLVKPVLIRIGAKLDVWRVAVKPGKPFLFGRADGCAIFGLPGNPVSAFVTFLLFVRPALLKMAGAGESELSLPTARVRLACDLANSGDRAHYIRGRISGEDFEPVGRQESHALYSLSRSNALLRLGAG
ncbi:MAG: molybdopterin molybdotransferase MoeA, partial [Armatimonadetes bacterium]|nr:molybdopterin molybdotransferase MoeA [Armatimonadota bacterium]